MCLLFAWQFKSRFALISLESTDIMIVQQPNNSGQQPSAQASTATLPRIHLCAPYAGKLERDALLEAFDSGWIAPAGPHLERFEKKVAALSNTRHAVALSSGTAALHLGMLHMGVGRGDTVLCSTLTFAASANAITYTGAQPIFIDAEASSYNLCPERLEEALSTLSAEGRKPKAVQVVHLFGHSANMDAICSLCERYEVPLIEDAAEALGANYRGRKVGSFGQCAVFSFNGNKIATSSGGGMLVSNNEKLIAHARKLSTQAREPDIGYLHKEIGYNYRLSNLLAALGLAQVEQLDTFIARHRETKRFYQKHLADLPGLSFMPEPDWGEGNHWLSVIAIDDALAPHGRDAAIAALEAANIEARPIWRPMHEQPVYRDNRCFGGEVASALYRSGICLPSGTGMGDTERQRVVDALRKLWDGRALSAT